MLLTILIVSSCLLSALGAWLLYLAAPQQLWRARGPWPTRLCWLPGIALLAGSVALLLGRTGTLEAIAICLCAAMLVWSVAPFLGAWRASRRGGRP